MDNHNDLTPAHAAAEAGRAFINILIGIGCIIAILLAMSAAMMETLGPLNQQFKAEQAATATAEAR